MSKKTSDSDVTTPMAKNDMSPQPPTKPPLTTKDEHLALSTTADVLPLTTNAGQPISTDQNSLKAGKRGPTLLEDFVMREKIQHFDHERIPERIVHARGAAAHGFFQMYESLSDLTVAKVLTDTSLKTPVFVRFSTVAGSRGSADTARDVRGFAVKLYTPEGNWDLVGNNIPVFFIQDAIKFPDLIHAAKPEPHNEIPQAQTAHDTFWDFISLTPESTHMIMWVMSDRGIPRSYNLMEGFGVHTFRLVNAEGKSTFVKFHWKPILGVHSLVWDEAQKIAGKDPDFHRRGMWEAIKLGIQTLAQEDEQKFDFDILDATKIWPEELLPVRRVGKMTLNRNPDNYFSETEQVAFNVTNLPPGIDLSNDPLLQGRTFSYLDTQLSRLGSPNFTELPINRPITTISNNQRDAQMRYTINKGRVSYAPASLDDHDPDEVTPATGGFVSYEEQVNGPKVRVRSETFGDHFGQAKLFWNSMTPPEKEHIAKALQFELGHVETRKVRQRMIGNLAQINDVLASQVAAALGESAMVTTAHVKPSGTADSLTETQALANATSETTASGGVQSSSALSMEKSSPVSPKGRKVAILVEAGVDVAQVKSIVSALTGASAKGEIVGPHLGVIEGSGGTVEATKTYAGASSVVYDAVFVPGGASVAVLTGNGDARAFIAEAYKHAKAISSSAEGSELIAAALHAVGDATSQPGVFPSPEAPTDFIDAIGKRHWGRAGVDQVGV
jgi:catalase